MDHFAAVAVKDVGLKPALLDRSVRQLQLALAVLIPGDPLALIDCAIGPAKLAIAVTLVFHVFASVDVSAVPDELAIAFFAIVLVSAFECVAVHQVRMLLPPALAVLHALREAALVDSVRLPGVGAAVAVRQPKLV